MAKFLLLAVFVLLSSALLVSAEDPPVACNLRIIDMIGCINYVQVGSNLTKPDPDCCFNVKSVVAQVSPLCLCVANDRATKAGFVINATRTGSLAGDCNVAVPDHLCQDTSPSPAPQASPVPPTVSPSPSPSAAPPVSQLSPPQPSPAPAPVLPPAQSEPVPPLSPPLPSQPSPAPEIPPVGSPSESDASSSPSQPSPAPEIPPVGSPSESDASSSRSATQELPSSVVFFAGVVVAGFTFLGF